MRREEGGGESMMGGVKGVVGRRAIFLFVCAIFEM